MGSTRIVPYTIEIVVDRGVWTPIEWYVRQPAWMHGRGHADGRPSTLNIRRWVAWQERSMLPGGVNEHLGPVRILSARIKDQRRGVYVAEWNRSEDPAFSNRATGTFGHPYAPELRYRASTLFGGHEVAAGASLAQVEPRARAAVVKYGKTVVVMDEHDGKIVAQYEGTKDMPAYVPSPRAPAKKRSLWQRLIGANQAGDDMDWYIAARRYLERLGQAEFRQQGSPPARGRKGRKVQGYVPSEYHRTLISFLGRNDEEGFKRVKMLEGYASALGF